MSIIVEVLYARSKDIGVNTIFDKALTVPIKAFKNSTLKISERIKLLMLQKLLM